MRMFCMTEPWAKTEEQTGWVEVPVMGTLWWCGPQVGGRCVRWGTQACTEKVGVGLWRARWNPEFLERIISAYSLYFWSSLVSFTTSTLMDLPLTLFFQSWNATWPVMFLYTKEHKVFFSASFVNQLLWKLNSILSANWILISSISGPILVINWRKILKSHLFYLVIMK